MASNAESLFQALTQLLESEPGLSANGWSQQQLAEGVVWMADLSVREALSAAGFTEAEWRELLALQGPVKTQALQALLEKLCQTSLEDGLTGAYNRRYFERALAQELERSLRETRFCGLILFDIDHFKQFNDRYGHDVGDRVLQHVARNLQSMLRSTDTLSRVGGEEFAVMVTHTFRLDLAQLAERLRACVADLRLQHGDEWLKVTISLGATLTQPGIDLSAETVYKLADTALYKAKRGGRNRVEFELPEKPAMRAEVSEDERAALLGIGGL